MSRSLTLTLAQYAASTSIAGIPENVRERARQAQILRSRLVLLTGY